MKTTHVFYGILVFFAVVLFAWAGATTDLFFQPPAENEPPPKQQAQIAKPSPRQKKKNCHCCNQTMGKLKQVIADNFAEKQAEKQASVVSQAQH